MKFLPPHILIFIQIIFSSIISSQSPIKVEIKKDGENWQLIRDGKPYYIKGAGGSVYMDQMVANGANSLRTWGAERAGEILDEAHKHGLTVMLGLWVQHERHGFDYDNKNKIQKQLIDFREIVLKYKDHPALLLWGVGNEVDLNYTNTNVWDAINDIAKMIHELDPNHPTSTVTAGLDSQEVVLINKKAPHIDIYGINTYADINYVKDNIRKFGWKGPYMITEWGPTGHWES
ncbi:MAG: glycoside hydrolase family 2 TIM barrel-domain containing protein, partial [Bacteroidota bacterium]